MEINVKEIKLLREIAVGFVLFPQYTLEQIANHVGVNKSTIHRLFGKKEDISNQIIEIASTTLKSVIDLIRDKTIIDFRKKFSLFTEALININELILYSLSTFDTLEQVDRFMSELWSALDEFFRYGKKLQIVKMDVDSKFISDLYIHSLSGTLRSEMYGRTGKHDIQNSFEKLFLFGILENTERN